MTNLSLDFDCTPCETKTLFGTVGVCDQVEQRCICPEGFSGRDVYFELENRCHVNDDLKYRFSLSVLILAVLSSFICTIILVVLPFNWDILPEMSSRNEKFAQKSRTVNQSALSSQSNLNHLDSEVKVRSAKNIKAFKQIRSKRALRRKRTAYVALIFTTATLYAYSVMAAYFVAGKIREEDIALFDISFQLQCPLAFTGTALWYYSVFLTLNELRRYGRLLGVSAL